MGAPWVALLEAEAKHPIIKTWLKQRISLADGGIAPYMLNRY